MRIELDLTDLELFELRHSLHSEGLGSKITRAIERAESFVDDGGYEKGWSEGFKEGCR
jgi:hypothetical protein